MLYRGLALPDPYSIIIYNKKLYTKKRIVRNQNYKVNFYFIILINKIARNHRHKIARLRLPILC